MRKIRLNLGLRSYPIIVGNRILPVLGKYLQQLGVGDDAYVITNAWLKKRYGRHLTQALKRYSRSIKFEVIPDTEKSKSMERAQIILKNIARYDKKKSIFILAFGGGVVGDVSGFVSAIYKRGIPYVQVPTTFLAQVDSAIGGKTAVDLPEGKNLIGAFYQPRLVFSDVSLLNSLDLRQLRSGLAEAVKYGLISDKKLFTYLESNYMNILSLKPANLEYIVERSSAIKAKFVARDERDEKGVRALLNLGHTIGHALEAASGYERYTHGEAVALGISAAAKISRKMQLIDSNKYRRIEALLLNMGLPVTIKNISIPSIIKAHYRDKKFIAGHNRLILLKDIGKAALFEDIPLRTITEALKK
ncbi:MAG: 3-dehydroquinate synthase [Candidatus Omnitrophota bacterium]